MIIYDVLKDILINLLVLFTIIFLLEYAAARINVDSIVRYFKFLRDHFFLLLNDSWEYIVASQYKQLYTLMQL